MGIDIDFVLNHGDAVDSKWAPSADADPEDDEAQYQLVVCSPEDPLPFTSPAFVPLRDVADPLQDGPTNKMSGEEASGGALSDADAECLSKRARTDYHLDKTGNNAGKQNANVDGECLMNV